MLHQPEAALRHSPARYTETSVRAAAAEYASHPPNIEPHLPPPTGNRYIVLGGAGFLGGWIVLQLLQRGEDPQSIRVLDIQPVTRPDLLEAQAKGVEFLRVDVSDEDAVLSAFSQPWPRRCEAPLTVIHTASNIRFFERHELQLPASTRVNVLGTKHVIKAAKLAGASVLIYTSSGSIAINPSRFWIWPWEAGPRPFVHLIDDDSSIPRTSSEAWSNYAATKIVAESLVREADNTLSATGKPMRTSCLRPGNGVFGPGGKADSHFGLSPSM
ncbi:NAD(P)-binding protein [Auricularia subglabra TFB-10046 SS5]|nr:NAD(P)-binding protein [Auricularia subglabra TFB-10046 SS5]